MNIGVDANIFRFPRAGIARYLHNTLKYLLRLMPNDQFFLYTPKQIKVDFSTKNFLVRIGKGLSSNFGSLWFNLQGLKYIVAEEIDVFWGQNHILPHKIPHKILAILTVHDLTFMKFPWTMPFHSYIISKLLFKSALDRANYVIAASKSTAHDLVSIMKIPAKKIKVIHEGYDEKFRKVSLHYAKEVLKKKYRLNSDFILSIGTIEPRKNYPVLLRAISKLKSDIPLIIIGSPGWKYRPIFRLAEELSLKKKVSFLGYVSDDDLVFFYNAAKVMVYPSLYEGFGLPVLEAMACGTPVICSNTSSLPEVGGDAVCYFDPYSVEDLLNNLEELLSSSELRRDLACKGLKRVKRFSFLKTARLMAQFIKDVYENDKQ